MCTRKKMKFFRFGTPMHPGVECLALPLFMIISASPWKIKCTPPDVVNGGVGCLVELQTLGSPRDAEHILASWVLLSPFINIWYFSFVKQIYLDIF
jgi:hypothetical protein